MTHMVRVLGFGGLLAAFVAITSTDAFAEKKKNVAKEKDKNTYLIATDGDYKALRTQRELTGKLVTLDNASVIVRVEYPHWEANPKYKGPTVTNPKSPGYNQGANQQAQMWRTYNEIQREQQRAAMAKSPREYQQAMQRIAQDMYRLQQDIMRMNQQAAKGTIKIDQKNQPFVVVTSSKDFELELTEKVVFRKLILPFEYDDTGNPKTYTEKEKAALRGEDKTKPGYMAKVEEFTPGMEVKLTLAAPKKKAVDKDAEKDAKAPEETPRPTVSMVVMTKEGPQSGSIIGAPKKGKK